MTYAKSLWSFNPLPRDCVLYLPLWSPSLRGDAFKSIDPFGHAVAVTGATLGSEGRTLDGATDILVVADNAALDIGTGDFTVIEWVKLLSGAADNHQSLFDKRDGSGSPYEGYALYFTVSDDKIHGQVNDADQIIDVEVATGVNVDDETWRMYAMSVDRDSATGGVFSLNGVQIGSGGDFTAGEKTIANTYDLNIGKDQAGTNNLKAIVGEVYVYNRVLTLAELLDLYQTTEWRYL